MPLWKRPNAAAEATGRPSGPRNAPVRDRSHYSMWMWRCAVVLPHPALRPAPPSAETPGSPAGDASRD